MQLHFSITERMNIYLDEKPKENPKTNGVVHKIGHYPNKFIRARAWYLNRKAEKTKMPLFASPIVTGMGRAQKDAMNLHWETKTSRLCVASLRERDGASYARKDMIRYGKAKTLHGVWEVEQLSPELQTIVKRYRDIFDGKDVIQSIMEEQKGPSRISGRIEW